MSNMAHPGEFELIRRYFARGNGRAATSTGVELGIGDDAAVLRVPEGEDLVAAVDTIVEGRHFPLQSEPRSVGHRALAVNLSDLAAMGAQPRWALLALTIPASDEDWLEGFAGGLLALADQHGVALVGGDTTAGPLTISVQMLGSVPRGGALRRSGAQEGDLLVVTGSLGDAAAGLDVLQRKGRAADDAFEQELVRRFEYPTPHVQLGLAVRRIASAAMDLSDGLAGDLPKLAQASGLSAHVQVERLPQSAALRATVPVTRGRDFALAGGDDYELLLTVSRQQYQELASTAQRLGVALTTIGEMRRGGGVNWSLDGRHFEVTARGYDHFR
jgi:thiamine-monophosphate kinase